MKDGEKLIGLLSELLLAAMPKGTRTAVMQVGVRYGALGDKVKIAMAKIAAATEDAADIDRLADELQATLDRHVERAEVIMKARHAEKAATKTEKAPAAPPDAFIPNPHQHGCGSEHCEGCGSGITITVG